MALAVVDILPGLPLMARSYAADAGSASFSFELACPTTVSFLGLVWDYQAGATPQNPDSYYFSVDGLPVPEAVWAYGCTTTGLADQTWSWQQVSSWTMMDCDSTPFEVELAAGTHEITLLNREAGGGIDAAAIIAIVVTEDPSFDPNTFYDPAE